MNTLKRKLTAILLTFAMLFSLMPALPQAAEAATSSKENDLLKVDYYTQLGDQDRSIDVIVQTSDGEQLTSLKISDYNWGIPAADTITLKNTDYYIRDIQKNGSGVFAVTSVSETQANFSWTTMDNGDQIIVTVDSMDCAINDLITGGVTRTYRIYEDQVMKMICDQDKDIVNGNDLPSITTMKPVWKDSFYDTPGAGSNKTFMKADLTHSPNEKYWHLEVTCENGKIVQVQPYQIESIQITYEYNGTEKTITVPASDLVYYGHDVETYDIELNDPSFNIICFYNETDGLTGNIYQLYALRAVETNTALGTENMPPVPTYGDGSKYVFTNWEVNAWDGSGTTFDANDIVTEDINVYAKKLSTEGEGGIEIHVMNDNNALIERAVEIYNAENGDNLSVDQIDMDSIKIRVNGNQGTSTNEYYWENKWKGEYDWYWVANYNLSSLPGTTHNDRVPFAQIDNITIYFQANDGTVAGASTIEVGDTQEGIDYGELEKMQLGDERIIELRLKGPAVPPTEEELEGDSDNPGILGEDAVKVQCTTNEEEHEAITTGLLPDSYSVSEKATWKKINGEAAYYVDVTVEDDKYVENYNNSHKGHTLDGADSQTITLKWNGSAWTPVTDIPVTFNVKCESEEPTEPETPSDEIVKELLENAVTVECNNESATHDNRDGKTYGLIEDGYTLAEKVTGDADDGYTYTVTIQPDAYVSQYSTDTKVTHTQVSVVPENSTITLEWTGTEWQVAEDSTTVTITVHCDSEEPTTPEKPNEGVLNDLLDVELDCDSNVGHQDKVYENLLSDSYTLDEDVTQNADGTYTIGVTVNSAAYIANYDGQELDPAGKHEIKKGTASETKVTLMYNEDEKAWTVDDANKLITFLIVCSGTGAYDINGIAKDLVAGEDDKTEAREANVDVDAYTIPESDETTVTIPYNGEVTLLYKITVTGNANDEANFVVSDAGADFVQAVGDVTITEDKEKDTFSGTVPVKGEVSFYVSKTFTEVDKDGELSNIATVAGKHDETVDPGKGEDEETIKGQEGEQSFTLTYDANGGNSDSVPSDDAKYASDQSVTLNTETIPTHAVEAETGWSVVFLGWSQTQTSKIYDAGENYGEIMTDSVTFEDKDITVYAVWGYDQNGDGIADAEQIVITPADIVAYTGGEGYTGVLDQNGEVIGTTTNGMPEPGFYLILPYELNEELTPDDPNEMIDLTGHLRFSYDEEDAGVHRSWDVEKYNPEAESIANGKYIYRLIPTGENQPPVRLEIKDGDSIIISDQIEDFNLDTLYKDYDMKLYTDETIDRPKVTADYNVEGNGENWKDANVKGIARRTATLTIRGTTDDNPVSAIQDTVTDEVDTITAVQPENVEYLINDSDIPVIMNAEESNVQLLNDTIVDEDDSQQAMEEAIVEAAASDADVDIDADYTFDFRYLDLVDTDNGNAYVTLADGQEMTIYWPYPEGMDENDTFYVAHFDGLDRDFTAGELASAIDDSDLKLYSEGDAEYTLETTEQGIKFTTSTFSPFALVYDASQADNPGGDDHYPWHPDGSGDDPDGLNTEDHFSYVVGYEDGMVKPQRSITRAEVATIFYRLLEDDVRDDYDTTRNNFSDVTSDSWYNQTVSTLASMGILKGYEDGTFRPNASITRAEFAAIATRFFEETGATYEPGTFTDVTGSEWFAGAIMDAVNLGLIGGYEDGTVRPNNNITRAEACAIVNRTLGRVPDADHLLPTDEMKTWPDNPESAWFYADMQEATNGHEYEWITEDGNKIEEWTDILDKDWNDR